jgi:hypothetical protein
MVFLILFGGLFIGIFESEPIELAATAVSMAFAVYGGIGGFKAFDGLDVYWRETSRQASPTGDEKQWVKKRRAFLARLSLECICLAMLLLPPPVVLSFPHLQFSMYWIYFIALVSGSVSYANNKLGRAFAE